MEKTLALDLGSNSIGWSIRDTSEQEQFKKFGVITFNKGVGEEKNVEYSFAAHRTSKRSIRRLYQARKYKLWATLKKLREHDYCPISEEELKQWSIYDKAKGYYRKYPVQAKNFEQWIKLDFNGDGKPDYDSPYQLRKELIEKKFDFSIAENRYKLGRALYHIAQHRAFKSSKKVNFKDEIDIDDIEVGAEGRKNRDLEKKLTDIGIKEWKTVGEAFAQAELIFKERKEGRIRDNLHTSVSRKNLQKEVEFIFEFQGLSFEKIFKEKNVGKSVIFWQRPLRSQKGNTGKCTLEPNKFRGPVSHPAFEEFRAWSFLNNIKYKVKDIEGASWKQIPLDHRQGIYDDKFFRTSKSHFDFIEIYDWIKKKNGHDNWILNYNFKTNVSACPVSARLKEIFGEKWKDVKIEHSPNKKRSEKKTFYDITDIWHIPFSNDDKDFVGQFASEKLKLDKEQTEKYLKLWDNMPVDYGQLSLKAINNILPFLRKGLIYTEAVLLAKLPDVLGKDLFQANEELLLKSISSVIEENRKTKKNLNIVNSLIAGYKALPREEKFAEKDFSYKLQQSDITDIEKNCIESYGEKTWRDLSANDKEDVIKFAQEKYQDFFSDKNRAFNKMPHLLNSMKDFIRDNFNALTEKQINKLYHPSEIEIYPPAKPHKKDGKLYLGSPKTGSFKNPMAIRALHEVKKLVNYLICNGDVDSDTRIVVEIARELNDANKRWAIEKYQEMRRNENEEFATAIIELLKDPEAKGSKANHENSDDIDKFRLWYERIEGEDAKEGFEKSAKFQLNEKGKKKQTNKKGKEEEYEIFPENNYERINKSIWFKLQKAKDNTIEKYRLWKQQKGVCIYTGKMIGITQLFQENVIDFEHTIPRSISFDNSLQNRTVCYKDYNRSVKRNRIPFECENYKDDYNGYSAILPRLQDWEQKVKDFELHIEYWKGKAKRGSKSKMVSPTSNVSEKDFAIRQKHLWHFELDYWKGKLSRFKMEEIKTGWRNAQLVDTQIISKYASHYLKTVFNRVEVQKGAVTAEFRKILGIQELHEEKDRSIHSHHAKDAVTLAMIPDSARRELILKKWYEFQEKRVLLSDAIEKDRENLQYEVERLETELQRLKNECRFINANLVIEKIDKEILINNIAKDQALTPSVKRIRHRGKVVPLKKNGKILYQTDGNNELKQLYRNAKPVFKNDEKGNLLLDKNGKPIPVLIPKEKWAKGDIIRGQLHKESFYGAIKLVKEDTNGKWIKNDSGGFEFLPIQYVIREPLKYKSSSQQPGFKDLHDLETQIVDKHLFAIIKRQVNVAASFKDALNAGIWMFDKKGNKVNKIKRVRIFVRTKNPVVLKEQSHKSKKPIKILDDRKHKESFFADSAENYACILYQNEKKDKKGNPIIKEGKQQYEREFEIYNLFKIAAMKKAGASRQNDLGIFKLDENGNQVRPYAVLKAGTKVIFYKNSFEELKDLLIEDLCKRIYVVKKFSGSRITFDYHLEARNDDKLSEAFPEKGIFYIDKNDKGTAYGKRGKNGFTESIFEIDKLNNGNPWPRLLYSKDWFDFAIEGKHFNVLPDGKINWLF